MKPYNVDHEKWNKFSKDAQLKNIAAELSRAVHGSLYSKEALEKTSYERALLLIEASLQDQKWEDKSELYQLHDAISAMYVKKIDPAITRLIFNQLIK